MSESLWRTTAAAVAAIYDTDPSIVLGDLSGLTPFIDTSNNVVTNNCTASGYDLGTLELIERWLSAHFYSIRDPQAQSEGAGGVSQSVFGRVDLDFNQTRYGQQALILDFKGNLAALQKRLTEGAPQSGAIWLGTHRGGGVPRGPFGAFDIL